MRPALAPSMRALALAATATGAPFPAARAAPPGSSDPAGRKLADVDRSQSPYFVVKGATEGADTLPLKDTRADVEIAGVIAHVRVTQVYKNEGTVPLEAIYVFPGSTRAAVFGMKMTVGDRTIVAEIQKKDEARKIYEAAKNAGKTASLLEQQRPNVFQMNVANILPGDTVKVEMDYSELLVATDGTYEFVYPATVGPRYTGESTSGETWTAQPYKHEGEKADFGWDIGVRIAAGMPIQRIMSSSHPVTTNFENPGTSDIATVTLANKSNAATKDFVLQYQLAGKRVDSGALLFEGGGEKFFLAMVQPPEKVEKALMPAREYVFILDVSGSMHGFPLDTAKTVINQLFDGMTPNDRFNILFFSGGGVVLSPEGSLPVTPDNLAKARALMATMRGGGGTEILGALRTAFALPTAERYARTFVAVTDGYVSVEPQVFQTIRDNLGKASFFAFGIGSSVNRFLIEGMARSGLGEPFIVQHGDDAVEKAAKFKKYIDSPALTNITVKFDGFDAYDVEPASVPDLFASRPVLVFGKYRGEAKGAIHVTGISGAGVFAKTLLMPNFKPSAKNEAIRYLWARHKIQTLSDYQAIDASQAKIDAITQLGLDYHLMTQYTSFVAVDERVRNQGGKSETVKQPLPLPEGVSDLAVGDSSGFAGGRAAYASSPTSMPAPKLMRVERDRGDVGKAKDGPAENKAGPSSFSITRVDIAKGDAKADDVRRIITASRARILACLKATGTALGKLALELTIDANGRVTGVRVVSGTAGTCLTSTFTGLVFPASGGHVGSTVRLDLAVN